jgi:uncharacterized protein (DUF4415 family)
MPAKEPAIKSDLARVDKLRDRDIDYSDIPELDDEVFAQPLVPWPPRKEPITIRVDADVLDWFKHQGRGYQTRINQVLRRYMDVATERVRPKTRTSPPPRGGARRSRRAG